MPFTGTQYAMAASLAALVIAAPLAFRAMQEPRMASEPLTLEPLLKERFAKKDLSQGRTEPFGTRRSDDEAAQAAPAKPAAPVPALKREIYTAVPPADGLGVVGIPAPEPTPSVAQSIAVQAPSSPAEEKAKVAAPAASRAIGQLSLGGGAALHAVPPPGSLYTANERVADFDRQRIATEKEYRDKFTATETNPVKQVAAEPVSTFSIDVDTASYTFARRALNEGRLPPKAAVRAEEIINYFDYGYPGTDSASQPFKPTVTVVPSPWNATNSLVHIGIKGYELKSAERPRANLVLLVDVSGSMAGSDKLPLVKNGLRMLVDELKPDDTVALVTYAAGSGVALEPTKAADKAKILAAIDSLGARGSTAGAEGIEDAYRLAEQSFDKEAVNRVVLATDGDFNVGITDQNELKGLIERKRDKGVFLSIIGVGRGNYNDSLMQTLAQNGNGVAAYADTLSEMRKVLVEESASTLFPIAKDVKIQVEWNPARVAEYRLIGYETRALKREDFNNDRVDAGDIGSGHTVTAIYEITPTGAAKKMVDELRYGQTADRTAAAAPASDQASNELGFLKMRFKLPKSDTSELISLPITDAMDVKTTDAASADVRFAIAAAGFAQVLQGSPHIGGFTYDDVLKLATPARGDDTFGLRAEFLNLVRLAKSANR